jgi:hypothetical protein
MLICCLLYILYTKRIDNRYTKIAYCELLIALLIRTVSCFLYAVKAGSEDLNSRLFDVLIWELPYYLLMQVAFALLFGWLTLRDVLTGILKGSTALEFESVHRV